MYIFICEDSIDGIFTGVYDAWASGYGHTNISLTTKIPENYSLFCEYITVETDYAKSAKVARTLQFISHTAGKLEHAVDTRFPQIM